MGLFLISSYTYKHAAPTELALPTEVSPVSLFLNLLQQQMGDAESGGAHESARPKTPHGAKH
jgi:hypothetical protein